VEFFDGSSAEINIAYLPPDFSGAFLRPGAELGEEAGAAIFLAAACASAEKAALRLVMRAEQCFAGLKRKLARRKHREEAVAAVLERLAALNLVNDSRYAELWLKSRIRRGSKAPRTLKLALREKGIDRLTAEEALNAALAAETTAPGALAGNAAPPGIAGAAPEIALIRRFLKKAARKAPERPGAIRQLLRFEGFSPAAIQSYFEEDDDAE
jgi:regulatory protein